MIKRAIVLVSVVGLCALSSQAYANRARVTVNVTSGLLSTTVLEGLDGSGTTIDKQTCSTVPVAGGGGTVNVVANFQVGAVNATTQGLTGAGTPITNCFASDNTANGTQVSVFCAGSAGTGAIPSKVLCFVD